MSYHFYSTGLEVIKRSDKIWDAFFRGYGVQTSNVFESKEKAFRWLKNEAYIRNFKLPKEFVDEDKVVKKEADAERENAPLVDDPGVRVRGS